MLTVAALWDLLDRLTAHPLPATPVPLAAALGRVLRADACADTDQPPFDRTAFDGYLARLDTPAPSAVQLLGRIAPGQAAPPAPGSGQAWRVLTGAALPPDPALGIVMQEDTAPGATPAELHIQIAPQAKFIRHRASQARAGATLLHAPTRLTPGALALLASVGVSAPLVTRRARVAHVVTGGELVPAHATPAPGQIRDSNSPLIAALLATHGAELIHHHTTGDDRAATLAALTAALALAPDVLLVSGGASVGDHDHTGSLLRELGFTVHADKVASRPGKPLLTATRGATFAFGLPGNPLSHFVCFHLFVARVLARLHGLPAPALSHVPLAEGAALRADPRETWWPATRRASGYAPLPWADSSDLTVLARAEALLRLPAATVPAATAEALIF